MDEDLKDTSNEVMAPMTSDYNENSGSQGSVWAVAERLFVQAFRSTAENSVLSTFCVADFGCATGGNSVKPLSLISRLLQERYSQAMTTTTTATNSSASGSNHWKPHLLVWLVDLPSNAWTTTALTVTPEAIAAAGGVDASETFVYKVGRSFYERCLPPESLDLSYSLVASHWMKSYCGHLPDGIYATDPLHVPNAELLQAWRDGGQRDWLEFTRQRHAELRRASGRLISTVACAKINGDYPWSQIGKLVADALKDNKLSDFDRCVLPCAWRTKEQVLEGFPPSEWDVELLEFHETMDPTRLEVQENKIEPNEYAKRTIQAWKAVSHQTFLNGMQSVSKAQLESTLSIIYSDCERRIAADPSKYNLDVAFWYVVARKL